MSKPLRITLPLDKPGARVVPAALGDGTVEGVEFPTINYDSYNGKAYQFAYFSAVVDGARSGYYDAS